MSILTVPATPVTPIPRANGAPLRPLPDPYAEGDGDKLFEVVRGQRVEKNMGLVQTYIAGLLYRALASFCDEHNLGHCVIETMFRIPGGNDRKPDVAFVSYSKWPQTKPIPQVNAWPIAPDLAVEVISPTDKAFDVMEKVREYFTGGVQQVWQIYSNLGLVFLFTSPTAIRVLTDADELSGDPIVPGFRFRVADLFPLAEPVGA